MSTLRALCLFATVVFPALTASAVTECGTLVQGVECALFQADGADPGGRFVLTNLGGFHVGDAVCVTGASHPCISICMEGGGCIDVTAIVAAPTPTLPPIGSCVGLPCSGGCAVCPPCTPGTICPKAPCLAGTCQVVSGNCECVTSSTPPPTPTFGGCGLACDSRPCFGQCDDGSIVQGFCTNLTVDRGCACAFGCASPTPTPTPAVVCTPPPCRADEVFYCPDICPGGCGTQCATPTTTPTVTATPTEPCTSVPCSGTCEICPPCTPGTVCPKYPCLLGTCQVVAASCACVPGIVTPTPTPTSVSACVGDCDGDGRVSINELVRGVDIALGALPPSACPSFDCPCTLLSCLPDIGCLLQGVNNALSGCPTPTPLPTTSVRYRLIDGSKIVYSPGLPQMGPVVEEPLAGAFTAIPASVEPVLPNTLLAFTIVDIEFLSTHFTVAGTGSGDVTTLQIPLTLYVSATVTINGQQASLSGGGPYDGGRPLPTAVRDLEVCGGPVDRAVTCEAIQAGTDSGYSLTIFAVPEG